MLWDKLAFWNGARVIVLDFEAQCTKVQQYLLDLFGIPLGDGQYCLTPGFGHQAILPDRIKAIKSPKSTKDSINAMPKIIGTKIFPEAPGFRAIPSSAAAAARP